METKHHFRKVYKSDFLCSADLEDLIEKNQKLIFTVLQVKQEYDKSVNGKKGNFNIAYFKEPIKPLVLNATNSRIMRNFAPNQSPMVEDWNNIIVELYIEENVKFGKEITTGVRIRAVQPKAKPIFTKSNFEKAKLANATIELIKSNYQISIEIEKEYLNFLKLETNGAAK